MKARFQEHILQFKKPAGTSRNILHAKPSWFIILEKEGKIGIGEVGIIPGLSLDDAKLIERKLVEVCKKPEYFHSSPSQLQDFPAIVFGLETAFLSLKAKDPFLLFENDFSLSESPIEINGLVWMGDPVFMKEQISSLISRGFSCIKLKIGAIDFKTELELIKGIRSEFSEIDLELRVDANGAFTPTEAFDKLKILSHLQLHSIEQPIAADQWALMAELCENSPIPIALDEELIGRSISEIPKILDTIMPHYIILKPGLHGGFSICDKWIKEAEERKIGWWATSALESNIGLNAIAQWSAAKTPCIPQGLGTGSLYTNNIPSPLEIRSSGLVYSKNSSWDLSALEANYSINGKSYTKVELLSYIRSSENTPNWEKAIFDCIEDWFNEEEHITFRTSGSTGKPKDLKHSKKSIKDSALLTANYFRLDRSSKLLLVLPAEYVAGKMMIYRALVLNCPLYYCEPSSLPRIDQSFDFAAFVPLQVEKILENGKDLNKINKVLIGGVSISKGLLKKMQAAECHFTESYGMTETLTHVALRDIGQEYFKALPSIEFSENDGALRIKAPHITDEWIQTNDLVKLKSSTEIQVLGRQDDVINSGGVKLHPAQIEKKLEGIIRQAFYIGSETHEHLGENLVLYIEKEGALEELDPHTIDKIKNALEKFEMPQKMVFVPTFKRTFSGKIIRKRNERAV